MTHTETTTMKLFRYLTVAATLILATLAGTSGDVAAQRAACHVDALAAFLNGAPAGTCAR